jgi:hypothetical protein
VWHFAHAWPVFCAIAGFAIVCPDMTMIIANAINVAVAICAAPDMIAFTAFGFRIITSPDFRADSCPDEFRNSVEDSKRRDSPEAIGGMRNAHVPTRSDAQHRVRYLNAGLSQAKHLPRILTISIERHVVSCLRYPSAHVSTDNQIMYVDGL